MKKKKVHLKKPLPTKFKTKKKIKKCKFCKKRLQKIKKKKTNYWLNYILIKKCLSKKQKRQRVEQ